MDYQKRREELVKELQELTNKVLQYQGAIAMLDEILAKNATPEVAEEKENSNGK